MSRTSFARMVGGLLILSTFNAGDVAMADQRSDGSASARDAPPACTNAPAPVPLIALKDEPPPRLVVDAPVPSQLAEGRVVLVYCLHNLRILPVFGEAALGVSPRLGHLHITIDDGPYRWLDTSGQPVVVNKLPPGPHRILIELVDPTHRTLDRQVVSFTIPTPPFAP